MMSPLLVDTGHSLVVGGEDWPLSVPTTWLTLTCPTLSALLSTSPHLTTSIIIPDTNIQTLAALLDLLKTGMSSQEVSVARVEELAGMLGMENFSVSRLDYASEAEEVETKSKVEKVHSYNCVICSKSFNSQLPFGFHYCKHFYAELQSFDLTKSVGEQANCLICEETFQNQKAALCHVGVRHNLVNQVLRSKEMKEINFEGSNKKLESKETNSLDLPGNSTENTIVDEPDDHENLRDNEERTCGVCSEDFSTSSLSSLVLHYCDHFSDHLPSHFSKFYSNNSCNICNKVFDLETSLMSHIGVRHTKINIVLRAFNIPTIHFPRKKMILRKSILGSNHETLDEMVQKRDDKDAENINIKLSKFNCFVCGKGDHFLSNLGVHMATIHFNEDLKEFLGPNNSCSLCNKTFKTKQFAIGHVGLIHRKLDEALEKKGYSSFSSLKNLDKINRKNISRAGIRKRVNSIRKPLDLRCQICEKEEESQSQLKVHMVLKHYLADIRVTYKSLYRDSRCLLCSKSYPTTSIWQHIGAVHNKLDEILLENGLKPFTSALTSESKEDLSNKTDETVTGDRALEEDKPDTNYTELECSVVEENTFVIIN